MHVLCPRLSPVRVQRERVGEWDGVHEDVTRGEGARVFLHLFYLFCWPPVFFVRFLELRLCSGSVGARNRPWPVRWIISLSYSAHPTIFWGRIIMRLICLIILLLGALRMRASYCALIFV